MPHTSDLPDRARPFIPNGMHGRPSVRRPSDSFPQFRERAEGAGLWDTDGHGDIDVLSACGSRLFGYGNVAVGDAFLARMRKGDAVTKAVDEVMGGALGAMNGTTPAPIDKLAAMRGLRALQPIKEPA